jgi:hypothetical protein
MVVEKQPDDSHLPDLETQSALLITTKERVNDFQRIFQEIFYTLIIGWNISFLEFSGSRIYS